MRVKNPATVQMVKGIVNGGVPIARVAKSENAENVQSSVGGTPLGEIFETDMKTVKSAACAGRVQNALLIKAGGQEYAFDGSSAVTAELNAGVTKDWANGQSGALRLTLAGTYQIYASAKDFSDVLYLGQQNGTAYGTVHADAGGSMQICVIGGVVYVYTGNAGAFPTVSVKTPVSARILFE